jgi:hypothetical protein
MKELMKSRKEERRETKGNNEGIDEEKERGKKGD